MAKKQAQKQLKDPKPTIIGAGITEQWYFKHLQTLRKYSVKIKPPYFGRENAFKLDKLVDKVLKDEGFAIVVFDADVAQRNDKERQLVKRMKVSMPITKMCCFATAYGEKPLRGSFIHLYMNEKAAGGVPQCRKYVYAGVVAVGILLSGVRAKGLFA